jgi:N-acetylneuraminate synthase
VIEKHITLDRTMDGPDHQFALEPDELRSMIKSVRACETALGERRTDVLHQERELRNIAVRRIYARKDLVEGDIIGESDILVLRPGKDDNALPAKFFDDIVGGVINKDVHANEPLSWDHLQT